MKLFRRKSSAVTNVPPEVAEYYQAERRERKGVAWLMTLLALLVTVAIVLGLFLAGRWLYRSIRGNDTPTPPTSQTQDAQNQDGTSQNSDRGDGDNRNNAAQDSQSSGSNDTTDDNERSNGAGSSSTNDESSETDSNSAEREPTRPPASDSDELANTGPGETVAALFVIAATAGYATRTYRLQRR